MSATGENEESQQNDEQKQQQQQPPLWRTTIRQTISPYLPPPVVSSMTNVIDPALEPMVGPEASMTLGGTIILGLVIMQLLKIISALSGQGRAIATDDDDDDDEIVVKDKMKKDEYGETVLVCGPMGGGKTRLFYSLVHGNPNAPTITSIQANVGLLQPNSSTKSTLADGEDGDGTTNGTKPIRIMDYPGHADWHSSQIIQVLDSLDRLVLVLDSTQSVSPAADILYHILAHATFNKKRKIHIMVDCHKADAPKAKNWRRIKIMLRTELERLLKVRATESDEALFWPPGKPLNMDHLEFAEIYYTSVSCVSQKGMDELQDFILVGKKDDDSDKPSEPRANVIRI